MQEDKEKEMTKDVVVSLKGLQLAPDQQSDAVDIYFGYGNTSTANRRT